MSELLDIVQGWNDPFDAPVIEKYGHVTVVNDSHLEYGSKVRFADFWISSLNNVDEIVYASPATGYAQISLSYLCRKYGMTCTLFEAKRDLNKLHEYQRRAMEFDANVHWVANGMQNVVQSRAREYCAKFPMATMAPFGLDHPKIVACMVKVARSIFPDGADFDEIWSVAGSGTLSRGLQLAFPETKVFAVGVGHKLNERERGRAEIIYHKLPFSKPTKETPPFASAPTYDAKAWEYIKDRTDKKILFWNVGA